MHVSKDQVSKIKKLLSLATPRPWRRDEHYPETFFWGPNQEMVMDHDMALRLRGVGAQLPIDVNGDVIVALVNEGDNIIADLEKLQKMTDAISKLSCECLAPVGHSGRVCQRCEILNTLTDTE